MNALCPKLIVRRLVSSTIPLVISIPRNWPAAPKLVILYLPSCVGCRHRSVGCSLRLTEAGLKARVGVPRFVQIPRLPESICRSHSGCSFGLLGGGRHWGRHPLWFLSVSCTKLSLGCARRCRCLFLILRSRGQFFPVDFLAPAVNSSVTVVATSNVILSRGLVLIYPFEDPNATPENPENPREL